MSFTQLGLACYQGRVDDVRRILDDGADVDLESDDYRTPLYLACAQGQRGDALPRPRRRR